MRRHFTATAIRSRLSTDHRQIILDIDGANAAVSIGFTPEILKRLISGMAWLEETQMPAAREARETNVLAFPVRAR